MPSWKNNRRAWWLPMIACLAACGGGGGGGGDGSSGDPDPLNGREPDINPGLPPYVSIEPENTGDGWPTSTPALQDIDGDALLETLEAIRNGAYRGVDSMLVVRRGQLVAEGYFNGFGRDSLHDLRSTGKSVTSALAGIAIGQGLMSLDDPISQHLPQFDSHDHVDSRKQAIRIRNLLNMDSGLDCDDWNIASPGNEERMYDSRDWVDFILDLPMAREPGALAAYCTGGVVVLGHIIALRSGMELDAYASTYLFGPLGIANSGWRRSPDGQATGGGGLRLTPRDAARFGALYLQGGSWNGATVVPAAWVEQSRGIVHTLGRDRYGLLWWKRGFSPPDGPVDSIFTSGNGGNFIFVFPALELVVVFTGSNYNSPSMNQPFEILTSRVLPAVR